MLKRLLLLLLLTLHAFQAIDLISAESSHVHNSTPEKKRTCSKDKGLLGGVCCDFCKPGTVVDHGCTETNPIRCKNCTKGAEYMDHPNLNSKCLRCSLCDTEHGMEVEENCTIYQNVKCRCKPGFFCSSEICRHCDPCATCEGAIEEECTQTKNTVCRSKGNLLWLLVLIPVAVVVAVVMIWHYVSKRRKTEYEVAKHSDDEAQVEMEDQHFPDIDLSPHISDIAAEMTKEKVMTFVRKLELKEGVIDALKQDNVNDTAELKIALLRKWYEQNGMRGAHETLIITLRNLKFRDTADKIEQRIKTVIADSPDIR